MTNERICPHCSAVVPVERIVCPACNRTMPIAGLVPTPAAQEAEAAEGAVAAAPAEAAGVAPTEPGQAALPSPPAAPTAPAYVPPQTAAAPPLPYGGQGTAPGGYQPPPGYAGGQPMPPRGEDNLAIAGLILSIVGIVSCCCLSFLCPVGLILSVVAHHKRPSGLSLAGIIVRAIGTVAFVLGVAWSIYAQMHPEIGEGAMRWWFGQMGIPMPPGMPGG